MRFVHFGGHVLRTLFALIAATMIVPSIAAIHGAAATELAQGTTQVIIAPTAPPPPQPETPPPAPNATVIWETGHWSWNGQNWVWLHGQYLVRPAPAANWVSGHWVEQPGGWSWVEGHWE